MAAIDVGQLGNVLISLALKNATRENGVCSLVIIINSNCEWSPLLHVQWEESRGLTVVVEIRATWNDAKWLNDEMLPKAAASSGKSFLKENFADAGWLVFVTSADQSHSYKQVSACFARSNLLGFLQRCKKFLSNWWGKSSPTDNGRLFCHQFCLCLTHLVPRPPMGACCTLGDTDTALEWCWAF